MHKPQVRPVQWCAGRDFAMGLRVDRCGFGIGWFKTETAGCFDGAQDDLQHMQSATGLKPVGMGGNSAHCMKAHRAACHLGMGFTAKICPLLIQLDRLFEGDAGDFIGDGADFTRRYADFIRDGLGGILRIKVAVDHLVEHCAGRSA